MASLLFIVSRTVLIPMPTVTVSESEHDVILDRRKAYRRRIQSAGHHSRVSVASL